MSLRKRLENVDKKQEFIVDGYFRLNYDEYIPIDVTKLTLIYLFIMDEFDKKLNSKNMIIKGINNTVCECISECQD